MIRTNFDTFKFTIYDNSDILVNTYTLTLAHGNYNNTELQTLIQTGINNLISETSTVVFNNNTGKITISLSGGYEIQIHETPLSKYVLGFTDLQLSTSSSLVATNRYNLSHDTYITLCINNLNSKFNDGLTTFHVPVINNPNDILTNFTKLTFEQSAKCEARNLTNITITVRDKYNNELTNNGIDMNLVCQIIF